VTPEALRVAMTPGCGHMDGMQQQQQQPHHFLPLRPPLCLLCHPFFSRRARSTQKKQGSSLCRQPVTFIFGRFFLLGTSVFVSEQKIISRAEAHGMCF